MLFSDDPHRHGGALYVRLFLSLPRAVVLLVTYHMLTSYQVGRPDFTSYTSKWPYMS